MWGPMVRLRQWMATRRLAAEDRRERDHLLSFAPAAGQGVSAERRSALIGVEGEHQHVRQARARLAADAEWDE